MIVFFALILSLVFRRAFYPIEQRRGQDYLTVAIITGILAIIMEVFFGW